MQFTQIDENNIYMGMIDAIAATPPDVGFYAPDGVKTSPLGPPPANQPGKWRDNGHDWVTVTEADLTAEAAASAVSASNAILTARMHKQLVQAETFTVTEFATFAKAGLFEAWAAGTKYVKGNRLVHEGVVYEVQQAVTAQAHQAPGSTGMLAIYRPISASGDTADGSRDKPYAYLNGMDVSTGKYYSFEGKLYLAKSDMKPCVWNPGTAGMWQWELAG